MTNEERAAVRALAAAPGWKVDTRPPLEYAEWLDLGGEA